MLEFKLPDVGEGMHEAEIVRWLVKPGETLKVDQPMLEIQTDKALVEIPSPVAGTVANLSVKEGQLAHVGDILITFETSPATRSQPSAVVSSTQTRQPEVFASNGVLANQITAYSNGAMKVRAAPAVRKKALELDVDLSRVKPSSHDGRVLLQDVLNYASYQKANQGQNREHSALLLQARPEDNREHSSLLQDGISIDNREENRGHSPLLHSQPEDGREQSSLLQGDLGEDRHEERKALVGLRRRIAERMEQSWRTIPHVATFIDVDGEELVALRKRLLPTIEKRGLRLTYLPLIVKAVIAALRQHPIFNSSLDETSREIIYKRDYHIGLATATPDGLLVPVVRHADRLSLVQLAGEISRLSEGARNRSLKSHELSGSTFTITNFGSYGGQRGTPIINPPEAAILGMGQLAEQAVARNGQVVVRSILPLTLSFDHRLIDGADSGAFTQTLTELLENPNLLMLDMV